jgi:hypothetical protein
LPFAAYGDSGSWVFDDDGHLYGHIIAAEPGRLTGFLVPAVELFREIEELLDGKVQLMSDYLPWLLERGRPLFPSLVPLREGISSSRERRSKYRSSSESPNWGQPAQKYSSY